MPLFGVLVYYQITPRFFEPELISAKTYAVIIITVFIPLITFFLLKNLAVVSSIHLREVRERKFPLMIQVLLLLIIIKMVFSSYYSPELYYFFVGILFSSIAALILVILGFKVSLHQIGIAGLTMFIIALSIHYSKNCLLEIGFLFFVNGWVASSRLAMKSHTISELVIGLFLGMIPQFIMLSYWL